VGWLVRYFGHSRNVHPQTPSSLRTQGPGPPIEPSSHSMFGAPARSLARDTTRNKRLARWMTHGQQIEGPMVLGKVERPLHLVIVQRTDGDGG